MGEMKSAWERAMERVEGLGKATDTERMQWKYVPEGEALAGKYLKQDSNLTEELGQYEEKVRKYVVEGVQDILLRNINLPRDETVRKNNKRIMDGLKSLKSDKVAVENVYSNIRRIFNHYSGQGEQQRKQAYERLKVEFEVKLQQAVQQQLGTSARIKMDAEKQPQFHEEWRKVQAQLDSQYLKLLDEYKQELSRIA